MCMICKGMEKKKFTPEEARDKLEEFVDLDLLDEEHQEVVESLIAEAEEEEYYWASAKKDLRHIEDFTELEEKDFFAENEESYTLPDDDPFEES